jgi:hypothetical protein
VSASALRFPDAHAFLAGTRPPGYRGGVFVVGGRGERRVTFYAQQCRALNLVAALTEADPELSKRRIAVVGAGAAGMTAGAALRRSGVELVRVFDRAAAPLHPQRASPARYLHPRIFHWPEAGWDEPKAALPLASWSADYADSVRRSVLDDVWIPHEHELEFCTSVLDVLDSDRPRVRFRRLGEHAVEEEEFDIVIVATGFPSERPAKDALGGSYWHHIESMDLLSDTIHVAVDGDGALTEVLMLFIDRLGHRGVEKLAAQLRTSERLREADFIAQGRPDDNADPPLECRSPELLKTLELLDDGRTRVVVHADRALKGKSFLLDRILVTHLRWTRRAPVDVHPQNLRSGAHPSGDPVIWRVGLYGAVPPRRFEVSQLATTRVLEQLRAPDPVFAGLVAQTVDALRRPMWTPTFQQNLGPGQAWRPEAPSSFEPACGALNDCARASLPAITNTFCELEKLGIPVRPDAAWRQGDDSLWISIETVVRCTSIPHEECIKPTSHPSEDIQRDQRKRLWFRSIPTHGREGRRTAVVALAEPRDALEEWIRANPGGSELRSLECQMLRGLADISVTGGRIQAALVRAHLAAKRPDEAIAVLLRTAAFPMGRQVTPTQPHV